MPAIPKYVPKDDAPKADRAPRRGRPPGSKNQAKSSKPLKPLPQIRADLQKTFGFLTGSMLARGDFYCATILTTRVPKMIDAWIAAAERNAQWHRTLGLLSSGGQAASFADATLSVIVPITIHHVPALQKVPMAMLGGMLSPEELEQMRSYEEQLTTLTGMDDFLASMQQALNPDAANGNGNGHVETDTDGIAHSDTPDSAATD